MKDINQILKLKEIDQLENAILQFSKNTLTTKKICATLLVGMVTIILKLTDNELDNAIYIGGLSTILVFWLIDSNSYYYQRKLRIKMSKLVHALEEHKVLDGYGMPLGKNENASWKKALFNESQIFYYLVFFIFMILLVCDNLLELF